MAVGGMVGRCPLCLAGGSPWTPARGPSASGRGGQGPRGWSSTSNARHWRWRSPKSRATPRGRAGDRRRKSAGSSPPSSAFACRLPGPPAGEVWIGDDAAVLGARPGPARADHRPVGRRRPRRPGPDRPRRPGLAGVRRRRQRRGGHGGPTRRGRGGGGRAARRRTWTCSTTASRRRPMPTGARSWAGDLSNVERAGGGGGGHRARGGRSRARCCAAVPGPATSSSSPARSVPRPQGSGSCGRGGRADRRGPRRRPGRLRPTR